MLLPLVNDTRLGIPTVLSDTNVPMHNHVHMCYSICQTQLPRRRRAHHRAQATGVRVRGVVRTRATFQCKSLRRRRSSFRRRRASIVVQGAVPSQRVDHTCSAGGSAARRKRTSVGGAQLAAAATGPHHRRTARTPAAPRGGVLRAAAGPTGSEGNARAPRRRGSDDPSAHQAFRNGPRRRSDLRLTFSLLRFEALVGRGHCGLDGLTGEHLDL